MSHMLLAVLVLILACGVLHAADTPLDLGAAFDAKQVATQDARITALPATGAGPRLQITTGHANPWPGITLKPPQGHWDLAKYEYLALDVRNPGAAGVTVCCRVDNPGADGVKNCITAQITLKAGETGTLRADFQRAGQDPSGGKLFGMRGYPGGGQKGSTIDPANVTQLLVFVPQPDADHTFEIANLRAGGSYAPLKDDPAGKPFFPLIDTFGQYLHRDWPGKTHSLAEMAQRHADEAQELAAQPGPADWDQYGGWKAGPTLKATGFFRVEKYQGKWWLVDPDGKLFISHGIDCVGELDLTPIDERDTWFEDFPGKQAEFQQFLGHGFALHGHYAGKNPSGFSFGAANLKRKYGADYRPVYAQLAHQRLRSWGLNTIANWSNREIYQLRKTPYTATLGTGGRMLEGSTGYWGKFHDVYDPGFAAAIRQRIEGEKGRSVGDPWCLGFFVDNEISWGDEVSLALGALQSPADQPAKTVFLDDLKAKYGEIAKLNAAWGTAHASWDALLADRTAPDKKKAADDLHAFYTKFAEMYFKTIRDAVKATAPNQLYLGCRFAWVNPLAAAAGAKYCDVVSYNLYRKSVADFKAPGDVPLIIGEFHLGALDRGMFHPGLVKCADQADRAKTYKDYVTGMLRHPNFVGCHWFKYVDEPTTGRQYDEENYQIGFLDIADTPYRETIDACREVGYGMYRVRMGP